MCPIFNVFDCTMTYLSDCILSVNLSSNHLNRMSIYNFFLVVGKQWCIDKYIIHSNL